MAREQRISVVMSLHEIDLAEKISDKIVCVKGDRIAGYGPPHEIFKDGNIASLFDIEKGAYTALLGSIELKKPEGKARLFIVGGGGSGIPFYRALQKAGVPFAAGILAKNDIDYPVAAALAETVISSAPYEPVTNAVLEEAKRAVDGAIAVVDCGCPAGEYNRHNAELIARAKESGKKIITSVEGLREVEL